MSYVQVRSARDLRNNYPEISSLVKDHKPVVITNNGIGDTVLISMEKYTEFENYTHHRYILNELAKAEERAADPNTKWYTHDEVWGRIMDRRKIISVADTMSATEIKDK